MFLGTTDVVLPFHHDEDLFLEVLSTEEPMEMIKPVSGDEIKNAMYDIDDQKALGLDGFSTNFYKSDWCVIGQDICVAVIDCLDTGGYLDRIKEVLENLVNEDQNAFIP
nr:hypothetical protein [Tanacetum cinerariifolium]